MDRLKEVVIDKVTLRLTKAGKLEFLLPTGWSGEKFERFKNEFEGELRLAISELMGIAPSDVVIPNHEPAKIPTVTTELFNNL